MYALNELLVTVIGTVFKNGYLRKCCNRPLLTWHGSANIEVLSSNISCGQCKTANRGFRLAQEELPPQQGIPGSA
jgi:hypothetical protein